MSDRINYLTVVLEHDIRDDDCAPLIQAIGLLRGVAAVKANVESPGDYLAEVRTRRHHATAINNFLKELYK